MCLPTLYIGESSLISLTLDNLLGESLIDILIHTQNLANDNNDVDGSEILLSFIVHPKLTSLL